MFSFGVNLLAPLKWEEAQLHPTQDEPFEVMGFEVDRTFYCLACFDRISWRVSGSWIIIFCLDHLRLLRTVCGCPSFVLCRPQRQAALNLRSAGWDVACAWFVPNHGFQPVLVKLLYRLGCSNEFGMIERRNPRTPIFLSHLINPYEISIALESGIALANCKNPNNLTGWKVKVKPSKK